MDTSSQVEGRCGSVHFPHRVCGHAGSRVIMNHAGPPISCQRPEGLGSRLCAEWIAHCFFFLLAKQYLPQRKTKGH